MRTHDMLDFDTANGLLEGAASRLFSAEDEYYKSGGDRRKVEGMIRDALSYTIQVASLWEGRKFSRVEDVYAFYRDANILKEDVENILTNAEKIIKMDAENHGRLHGTDLARLIEYAKEFNLGLKWIVDHT